MPINDSSVLKFRPDSGDESDHAPLGKFISMELPDEAVEILNRVMQITGDSAESLLRNSLGLYKIAVDAKMAGNKVAIVDPEGEFVHDIAGL